MSMQIEQMNCTDKGQYIQCCVGRAEDAHNVDDA